MGVGGGVLVTDAGSQSGAGAATTREPSRAPPSLAATPALTPAPTYPPALSTTTALHTDLNPYRANVMKQQQQQANGQIIDQSNERIEADAAYDEYVRSKSPLATENLPGSIPSVFSRVRQPATSVYADGRSSDDVIAFEGTS